MEVIELKMKVPMKVPILTVEFQKYKNGQFSLCRKDRPIFAIFTVHFLPPTI